MKSASLPRPFARFTLSGFAALLLGALPHSASAVTIANGQTVTAPGTLASPWVPRSMDIGSGLNTGNGYLIINGSKVISDAILGFDVGTGGVVTIKNGGVWEAETVNVGWYGMGTVNIESGSSLVASDRIYLGSKPGTEYGNVILSGGSSLSTDYLVVGWFQKGNVVASGASTVTVTGNANVGYGQNGGGGMIDLKDAGTVMTISGSLGLGVEDLGTLNILNGARLNSGTSTTNNAFPGYDSGRAIITVDGANSLWNISGDLILAGYQSSLTIGNGGQVINTTARIATDYQDNSILVTGAGSTWTNEGTLFLGVKKRAVMTVGNGGKVSAQSIVLGDYRDPNLSYRAGEGVIYLNGTAAARGVIETGGFVKGAGNGFIIVDGGLLRATADTATFLKNFTDGSVTLLSGGLFLDTNGRNIQLGANLASGVAPWDGPDGGVTKLGAGTLTFDRANTYTGVTTIQAGTLALLGDYVRGNLVLDSGTTLETSGSFTIDNLTALGLSGAGFKVDGSLNHAGTITGGLLSKTGPGTLTLSGSANNARLSVASQSGTVILAKDSSADVHAVGGNLTLFNGGHVILAGTGGDQIDDNNYLIIHGGGRLDLNGRSEAAGGIGGIGAGTITNRAAGTTSTLTIGQYDRGGTYDGVIIEEGGVVNLRKTGAGTVVLSGASTYTGTTVIDGGTLSISADSNIGTGGLFLAGASTLQATGTIDMTRAVTLTDVNGARGTFAVDAYEFLRLNGKVTGSFIKNGEGFLALGGSDNNSVSTVTVAAGTLVLAKSGAAQAISGEGVNLQVRSGARVELGGGSGDQIAPGAVIIDGTLDLMGKNEGFDTLSGTGAVTSNGWGWNSVLTLGEKGGTSTFGGVIYNGLASMNLRIVGGTTILSGANRYIGTTTLAGGTLVAASGSTDTTGALGQAGDITFAGGVLEYRAASKDADYSVRIKYSTGVVNVNTYGQNVTWAGDIDYTNTAGLAKNGAGELVLSGANSYSGGTSVNAGVLSISSDANLGAASGALTLNGTTLKNTATATLARPIVLGNGGAFDLSGGDLVISGVVSGTGALTKTNTAHLLTLGGNQTYTGATIISGGTLVLRGNSASSAFDIATGATLELSPSADIIYGGSTVTFTGEGVLTKTGGNALRWGGASAIFSLGSGSLIDVTAGLFVGGANANEVWTHNKSGLRVAAGATFAGVEAAVRVNGLYGGGLITGGYASSGSLTFGVDNGSGSFSGTLADNDTASGYVATLIKEGTGTQILTGTNSFTGTLTISGGTVQIGNSGATGTITGATGNIINNATLVFDRDATTAASLARTISGSGTFVKNGAGTLTLTAANTYTGATRINAGILNAGVGNVAGTSGALGNGGTVTFSGGLLQYGAASAASDYSARIKNSTGSILVDTNGNDVAWAGVIESSNTGGLGKRGAGVLTLGGNNTYTGATAVEAGRLVLSDGYASSAYAVASGAVLELNVTPAERFYTTSTAFSGMGVLRKTGSGAAIWAGSSAVFALGAGSWIDVQAGNFFGGSNGNEVWTANQSGLNVAAGANFYGVEANVRVDALTGAGRITSGYSSGTYQGFTFGVANGSGTFSGVLADHSGYTGNFTKAGTGTQTLSGANTYTGATLVSAGTLLVNGSLANTAVTVNSGATLGGSGTINGHTTINGSLAPGNSPGVLTFSGGLTLGSGSTTALQLTGFARGSHYDGIDVTGGSLVYGGTLAINFSTSVLAATTAFDLFNLSGGSASGSFSLVSIGGSYVTHLTRNSGVWTGTSNGINFTFTESTGDLVVLAAAIPEPATFAAFAGIGILAFAFIRRRS